VNSNQHRSARIVASVVFGVVVASIAVVAASAPASAGADDRDSSHLYSL